MKKIFIIGMLSFFTLPIFSYSLPELDYAHQINEKIQNISKDWSQKNKEYLNNHLMNTRTTTDDHKIAKIISYIFILQGNTSEQFFSQFDTTSISISELEDKLDEDFLPCPFLGSQENNESILLTDGSPIRKTKPKEREVKNVEYAKTESLGSILAHQNMYGCYTKEKVNSERVYQHINNAISLGKLPSKLLKDYTEALEKRDRKMIASIRDYASKKNLDLYESSNEDRTTLRTKQYKNGIISLKSDGNANGGVGHIALAYESIYKDDYISVILPIVSTTDLKIKHFSNEQITEKTLKLLSITEKELYEIYEKECVMTFIQQGDIREHKCFTLVIDLIDKDPTIDLENKITEFKEKIDTIEFVKVE